MYVLTSILLILSMGFSPSHPPTTIVQYDRPVSEEIALEGVRQMYNFQFTESRASFGKYVGLNPDHPSGYFYLTVLDWFTSRMEEEDTVVHALLKTRLDEVVEIAEKRLRTQPDDAFSMVFLGAAKGLRARISLARKNWVSAFEDSFLGFSAIREAMQMDTSMVDPWLGVGIFHYFIAISGPVVKGLAYVVGQSASREQAIAELERVVKDGKFASIEARAFLMFVNAYMEEDFERALYFAEGLTADLDRSPYLRGKHADILLLMYRTDEAQEHINAMRPLSTGLPAKYQHELGFRIGYLQAETLRQRGDVRSALEKFRSLEGGYSLEFDFNLGYLYLRMGMAYDETGDRRSAKKYYRKAIVLDNYTAAMNHARDYLQNPYQGMRSGGEELRNLKQ